MPELNGEAFVPPFCPALNAVMGYTGQPRRGMVVSPRRLSINFPDFDHSSFETGLVGLDVYFWATRECSGQSADITPELSPVDPGSEEGQNVGWLADLDDVSFAAVEREVGERYCERVKRCAGVLLRGNKSVCQALDPDAFHPIISQLRREAQ